MVCAIVQFFLNEGRINNCVFYDLKLRIFAVFAKTSKPQVISAKHTQLEKFVGLKFYGNIISCKNT